MLDKEYFKTLVKELREAFYTTDIPDSFFAHVYNLYKDLPEKNASACFQHVKENCQSRVPLFYHFRVAYDKEKPYTPF
jgi:hypothetical protein